MNPGQIRTPNTDTLIPFPDNNIQIKRVKTLREIRAEGTSNTVVPPAVPVTPN